MKSSCLADRTDLMKSRNGIRGFSEFRLPLLSLAADSGCQALDCYHSSFRYRHDDVCSLKVTGDANSPKPLAFLVYSRRITSASIYRAYSGISALLDLCYNWIASACGPGSGARRRWEGRQSAPAAVISAGNAAITAVVGGAPLALTVDRTTSEVNPTPNVTVSNNPGL